MKSTSTNIQVKRLTAFGEYIPDLFVVEIIPRFHKLAFSSSFFESAFFNHVVMKNLGIWTEGLSICRILMKKEDSYVWKSDLLPVRLGDIGKMVEGVEVSNVLPETTCLPIFVSTYDNYLSSVFLRTEILEETKNKLFFDSFLRFLSVILFNQEKSVLDYVDCMKLTSLGNLFHSKGTDVLNKMREANPDYFEMNTLDYIEAVNGYLKTSDQIILGKESKGAKTFLWHLKHIENWLFSVEIFKESYDNLKIDYIEFGQFLQCLVELNGLMYEQVNITVVDLPMSKLAINVILNGEPLGEYCFPVKRKSAMGIIEYTHGRLYSLIQFFRPNFDSTKTYKFSKVFCNEVHYFSNKRPAIYATIEIDEVQPID